MIVGYTPADGILHRAHPFTILTLVGSVVVLVFALPAPDGSVVLGGVLIIVAIVAGVGRALLPAVPIVMPIWFFLAVIHGLLDQEPLNAVTYGARITTMVLGFLLLIASVHPARLVDALVARGVPFAPAYLLAATLQAVPRLQQTARRVLDAQRCRGLRVRGSLLRRVGAIVPLSVPLVLAALAEVDDRAMALEARGVAPGVRRTALSPPPDSVADRVVRWALAAGTLVAVLARAVA